MKAATHPGMDLHINSIKIFVGSSNLYVLNYGADADALQTGDGTEANRLISA